MAYQPIMKAVEKLGGKPKLRMGIAKAGPIITDNGHFVIDADFGEIINVEELNNSLLEIPGILETGLFVQHLKPSKIFLGCLDGSVESISSNTKNSKILKL